jgi:hypothetical protein
VTDEKGGFSRLFCQLGKRICPSEAFSWASPADEAVRREEGDPDPYTDDVVIEDGEYL